MAALAAFSISPARADQAPRVHLKGATRIDVQAGRSSGHVVLSGTVTDDAAKSAAGVDVFVTLTRASSGAQVDVELASATPESCSGIGSHPTLDSASRISLPTDDAGKFCLALALPIDRYTAHLATLASSRLDAGSADVPFDLALRTASLRFDPLPALVSLDDETARFVVVATQSDAYIPRRTAGLMLQLADESGATIGLAMTDAAGRARFEVPSARLGQPGYGELRVSFGGTPEIDPSSRSEAIERRTLVRLVAPEASGARLPAASPEDGIAVDVIAKAECASRGCTALPTGTVEVHFGNTLVGAAKLERGMARVIATYVSRDSGEAVLRVSFAPDAPWYRPAQDLWLVQPVGHAHGWSKAATLLAGLGVIAWFVIVRLQLRPHSQRSASAHPSALPANAGPRLRLVHAHPSHASRDDWTGRIVDAHEGSPIGAADIRVERPGFQGAEVIARAASAVDGTFALAANARTRSGDHLVIESRLHSTLRRPLPAPGQLDIAMVLRKRAMLDRLVAWARQRGGPYAPRNEPTPADVRLAADPESRIAHWAEALEKAIYGGGVVDAPAESEIDRLGPNATDRDAIGTGKGDPGA